MERKANPILKMSDKGGTAQHTYCFYSQLVPSNWIIVSPFCPGTPEEQHKELHHFIWSEWILMAIMVTIQYNYTVHKGITFYKYLHISSKEVVETKQANTILLVYVIELVFILM